MEAPRSSTPLWLHVDSFWISPYVFTAYIALEEKGLAFETTTVALQDGAQHDPAFRDASITARVPSLAHGDFVLAESQAIVDYLEEAFPDTPRILPADVKDRARARQILAWIRSDLMALREERATFTMFYSRATTPMGPQARAAAEKLLRVAEALIPAGEGPLFGAWSIADADLAFMLHRLILNDEEVPARIRAYAEKQWARPSVQRFVNRKRDPYVPYG